MQRKRVLKRLVWHQISAKEFNQEGMTAIGQANFVLRITQDHLKGCVIFANVFCALVKSNFSRNNVPISNTIIETECPLG